MAKAKIRVPKAVADVSVPKRLRKAGLVKSILNHPLGRTILADVLVAAAGAAAAALNKHQASGALGGHSGDAKPDTEGQSISVTSDLAKSAAGALGTLALDVVEQVLPRKEAKSVKTKGKKIKAKSKAKNGNRVQRRKDEGRPSRHH